MIQCEITSETIESIALNGRDFLEFRARNRPAPTFDAECPWTRPAVRPKLLATMARRQGNE